MSTPAEIPWRSAALPLDAKPIAIEPSPDDRHVAILLPSSRTLRVIEMDTGLVVSERRCEGTAVQWIGPDLLLCGHAPRHRIEIELVRASSNDVVATWGADRRNESMGAVELGVTRDGLCGYLVSHLRDGPFGWNGDFARVAIDHDEASRSVKLGIVPIDVRLRSPGMGRSSQKHTRRSLERSSGQLLVVHQADVTQPFDSIAIDLRTGSATAPVETRQDLGPYHPVPRWVAPGLLMFGDVLPDFDGTKVWLTAVPPGPALREALVPRAGESSETVQAIASLRDSALHRDGRRVYGVHSGRVNGTYCTRGWITDLGDDLRAEPAGIWKQLPETLAWIGEGIIGAAKGIGVSMPLPFWRNARDESAIEVAGPPKTVFGYVSEVSTSPGGGWVMLRMDSGHAAWAPVEAFAAM